MLEPLLFACSFGCYLCLSVLDVLRCLYLYDCLRFDWMGLSFDWVFIVIWFDFDNPLSLIVWYSFVSVMCLLLDVVDYCYLDVSVLLGFCCLVYTDLLLSFFVVLCFWIWGFFVGLCCEVVCFCLFGFGVSGSFLLMVLDFMLFFAD